MFTKHTCDCQEPKTHENVKIGEQVLHDLTAFKHIEVLRLATVAVDDRLTAWLNAIRAVYTKTRH